MKTAGRENQYPWAIPRSRAYSAAGQNRSCSHRWAEKQAKLQPLQWCFCLTSPFIELTRHFQHFFCPFDFRSHPTTLENIFPSAKKPKSDNAQEGACQISRSATMDQA